MKKENYEDEFLTLLQEKPACAKVGRNPAVVDPRFDGLPKEVVEQDQDPQALISHLVNQGLKSSKKN